MSRPAMVFHVPLPLEESPRAGSTAHVARMHRAFADLGFDVRLVAGFSSDRRRAMRDVMSAWRDGLPLQFVYSSASTAPTSMNDPHHLPIHPLMDWRFLRTLRRGGVPVGLFYPDVYWRFPVYRDTVPLIRRVPAYVAYHFDLLWYRDAVDILFLPSLRMAASVPGWSGPARTEALEPGSEGKPLDWVARDDGLLRLFYVGSVRPPLYDIGPLVTAVKAVDSARLTICCPADQVGALADARDCERITIVHEHGSAVIERYARCDAACLVFGDDPYRAFAMPVKLFEAIGAGRPVIASSNTAVADFIDRTATGWTVDPADLEVLLRELAADPGRVARRRAEVLAQVEEHTWRRRAGGVASTLRERAHAEAGR